MKEKRMTQLERNGKWNTVSFLLWVCITGLDCVLLLFSFSFPSLFLLFSFSSSSQILWTLVCLSIFAWYTHHMPWVDLLEYISVAVIVSSSLASKPEGWVSLFLLSLLSLPLRSSSESDRKTQRKRRLTAWTLPLTPSSPSRGRRKSKRCPFPSRKSIPFLSLYRIFFLFFFFLLLTSSDRETFMRFVMGEGGMKKFDSTLFPSLFINSCWD